tara:strand:- start:361 stop:1164 length:804 start_codon:yes stop_codon:yes gene_type:complete
MPRTQSPSSINLFRQCPRKYFYQYIQRLPSRPSIHLIRGKVVHSVLEKFFKIDITQIHDDHFAFELKTILFDSFRQEWEQAKPELDTLDLAPHDKIFYYNDSKKMFDTWIAGFLDRLQQQMENKTLEEAFTYLTPITEKRYHSQTYNIQGFIDAIHHYDDGVHIYDYKTSKRDTMSEEYRLQLAIYAMLYKLEHKVTPKRVGINFLKFGEKFLQVDETLVEEARKAILDIHEKTKTDDKVNYAKKVGPLCKWSTGQCDFYDTCVQDE